MSTSYHRVLDPNSTVMVVLEMMGFAVLVNDLILSPFLMAWEFEVDGLVGGIAWFAGLYWALDLLLNFNKGYYRSGELQMEQMDIIHHYLRTWFVPDLLLLL